MMDRQKNDNFIWQEYFFYGTYIMGILSRLLNKYYSLVPYCGLILWKKIFNLNISLQLTIIAAYFSSQFIPDTRKQVKYDQKRHPLMQTRYYLNVNNKLLVISAYC